MAKDGTKTVVSNRKARHEFFLEAPVEAGLVLSGSEVKSLRQGNAHLQESFVDIRDGNVDLVGAHIAPYEMGGYANHEPRRRRRLLLNRGEIEKLRKGTEQKGYTIVPLRIYFRKGRAKLEVALGKGKKLHDKRHSIAEREAKRRIDREMRDR